MICDSMAPINQSINLKKEHHLHCISERDGPQIMESFESFAEAVQAFIPDIIAAAVDKLTNSFSRSHLRKKSETDRL